MVTLLVAALGLAIAALDPFGALIAIGLLTSDAGRRVVFQFGLSVIILTIALGVGLSYFLGEEVANIDWSFPGVPDERWALVQGAVGVLLLGWGAWRLLRPKAEPETEDPPRRLASIASFGTAVLFAVSAILDPTFVSMVVLAAHNRTLTEIVLAHTTWTTVSQLPLVIFLIALVFGVHERVIDPIRNGWQRVKPYLVTTGRFLAMLAGAVLLLDVAWWLVSDEWLIAF